MKNKIDSLTKHIRRLNVVECIVSKHCFTTTTDNAKDKLRSDLLIVDEDIRSVREYLIDELEKELEIIQ